MPAGRTDSETAKGVKAARWAELTAAQGDGFRVEGAPYIRVEGRSLRVLTSVVGRSEKGRRPENPEYRLDAGASASLGAHEHWNDATARKYSRNLGLKEGIELIAQV